MPQSRQPYVKPSVRQLHYMADNHVSLAAGCKTTNSHSGPTTSNCKTPKNLPCSAPAS
jgi:hypothetical protein